MVEAKEFIPLFQKLAIGIATMEERNLYMTKYADAYERKLGKPYYEFSDEEELDYNIHTENAKAGSLDITDGSGYFCEDCKNKGYIAVKSKFGGYAEQECKCMKIRRAYKAIPAFRTETFKSFDCRYQWQGLLKDKALAFLSAKSKMFYVGGTSGAGKSHICTAIAGNFLKDGKNVVYVKWLNLVDALNNCRFRNVEKYEQILSQVNNCEVLYIDDLLKGDNSVKPSPADIKLAYRIIDERYSKAKSLSNKRYITILSSEWSLEQLASFDTATAGRIRELAKDFVIKITGADKNRRFAEE